MPKEGLPITHALALTGLSRNDFMNATQRGLYPTPPVTNGIPRVFDLDELVAAYVLGWLYERSVQPAVACEIAVGVLERIRTRPKLETLIAWKYTLAGEHHIIVSPRRPSARNPVELFSFAVGDIRRLMLAGIKQKTIDEAQGGSA